MRIGSFEFNRRELSGSLGDFGTLLPLAIGYIVVCGMDPAGFLVGSFMRMRSRACSNNFWPARGCDFSFCLILL